MINLDVFRNLIRSLIGDKAIKMLSRNEWQEFTEYSREAVKMHNEGFNQMTAHGGNMDLKDFTILLNDFNTTTLRFINQFSFGVDQKGEKITFKKLFGEILSPHPSLLPSIAARFIVLWAIEHKINMRYRELYENKKPEYHSVEITNYTDLPKN